MHIETIDGYDYLVIKGNHYKIIYSFDGSIYLPDRDISYSSLDEAYKKESEILMIEDDLLFKLQTIKFRTIEIMDILQRYPRLKKVLDDNDKTKYDILPKLDKLAFIVSSDNVLAQKLIDEIKQEIMTWEINK